VAVAVVHHGAPVCNDNNNNKMQIDRVFYIWLGVLSGLSIVTLPLLIWLR